MRPPELEKQELLRQALVDFEQAVTEMGLTVETANKVLNWIAKLRTLV